MQTKTARTTLPSINAGVFHGPMVFVMWVYVFGVPLISGCTFPVCLLYPGVHFRVCLFYPGGHFRVGLYGRRDPGGHFRVGLYGRRGGCMGDGGGCMGDGEAVWATGRLYGRRVT